MNDLQQHSFLRGLEEAATSAVATTIADEQLPFEGDVLPPPVNPYTTTGFIVWYCFLFLCCGLPMLCCCTSICCLTVCRKLERSSSGRMGNEDDRSSAVLASEEEDAIALEIARIEANVRAFSLKEQQLRKSNLTKAWVAHKMIVGEESIVETKPKECCGESENDDQERSIEEGLFELQHIPLPGFKVGETTKRRTAASHCAICLESYRPDDSIVWSANAACIHIFHEQCMLSWIMKRFKPDCPVCRQTFVNMIIDEDSSSLWVGTSNSSNVVEHNVEQEGGSDENDSNADDVDAVEEAPETNQQEED